MRILVLVEPGPVSPPPDMLLGVLEAFRQWRLRWGPKMESFEYFAGRAGGWGVFDCDEFELSQAMMEFPFTPFSQISVHPTVEGDDALARQTQAAKEMLAAMGAQADS